MEHMAEDARWVILATARARLIERFADHGVNRVEYVAAFPNQDDFSVWLCTQTDEQRNRLGATNPLLADVREVLENAGFPARQLSYLATITQSQETVDRDYEGNWFYAMR
jgi:hypothetical protein